MKRFDGELRNYNAFIDVFPNELKKIEHHFISHCHADHYMGIENAIQKKGSCFKIYCSELTKRLLIVRFSNLKEENFYELEENRLQTLFINGKILNVMMIPSNHCPGSVMFFFQGKSFGSLLYTGDFRFENIYNKKFKMLRSLFKENITKVVMDLTFCHTFYENIPTRVESVEMVKKWIKNQIGKKPKIFIQLGLLGLESVICYVCRDMDIRLILNEKYCNKRRIKELKEFAFLENYFVDNSDCVCHRSGTRFYLADMHKINQMRKNNYGNVNYSLLRLSTRWTKTYYEKEGVMVNFYEPKEVNKIWHIIFSQHSSLSELREFYKLMENTNRVEFLGYSNKLEIKEQVSADINKLLLNINKKRRKRDYERKIQIDNNLKEVFDHSLFDNDFNDEEILPLNSPCPFHQSESYNSAEENILDEEDENPKKRVKKNY